MRTTPCPRRAALRVLAAALVTLVACKKPEPKTAKPGDPMKSFVIKNVESGQQYCQICAFAGKPLIMAVAELDDARFEETLVGLEGLLAAHRAKGLRAFAVLVEKDGDALGPPKDEPRAVATLRALKARLGLSFPLTILPAALSRAEAEGFVRFQDAYALAGTPALFLASVDDLVLWTGVVAPDAPRAALDALEGALRRSL